MVKTVTVPRANHFQLHHNDIHPYLSQPFRNWWASPSSFRALVGSMGPLFWGRAEMSWILRKSLLTSVLLVQPWRTEFTAGLDLGVEGHSDESLEPLSLWNSLSVGRNVGIREMRWQKGRLTPLRLGSIFSFLILTACGFKVCFALRRVSSQQLQQTKNIHFFYGSKCLLN